YVERRYRRRTGLVGLIDDRGITLNIVIHRDIVVGDELEVEVFKLLLRIAREREVAGRQQAIVQQSKSLGHAGIGARQVDVGADRHGALDQVELQLGFGRDQDAGKLLLSFDHSRIGTFGQNREVEAVATADRKSVG